MYLDKTNWLSYELKPHTLIFGHTLLSHKLVKYDYFWIKKLYMIGRPKL